MNQFSTAQLVELRERFRNEGRPGCRCCTCPKSAKRKRISRTAQDEITFRNYVGVHGIEHAAHVMPTHARRRQLIAALVSLQTDEIEEPHETI